MATPNDPVPQTVRMRILWGSAAGVIAQNVLHFRNPSGAVVSQTLAQAVGATVRAAYTTSTWDNYLNVNLGIRNVTIRDISVPDSSEFADSAPVTPGLDPGIFMPANVAFVVTLRTAKAGKSFRGRVYLGPIAAAANSNGAPVAGVGTAAAGFLELIRTSVASTHSLQLGVTSRWDNKVLRTPPITSEVLACVARDNRFDTQRNRLGSGSGTAALWVQNWVADHPVPPAQQTASSKR